MRQKTIFILLLISVATVFWTCKEEAKKADSLDETSKVSNDSEINAITALVDKNPLDPKLRYERAQILYSKKYYAEATEDLRIAILRDSLNPDYYHLLSDVFMDDANSSKALQTMEIAARLFPKRIPTLLKLSEDQHILQQYENSIGTLNEIIRQDAQNGEAYFMLGMNFRALGDEKRAINAFKVATEFDSKIIDAWIILGNIYEAKNSPEAAKYYEAAVNISPNNVNALHSKAFYLQNHDDIPGALQLYDKIVSINSDYTDAYLNAGILYLEQDSLKRALEQFNILSGKTPQDWKPYYFRSLAYKLLGNKASALADIKNSLNLNPDNEEAQEVKKEIEKME